MEVNHAYRRRTSVKDYGTWGNASIQALLREFPWLGSLIQELMSEDTWSATTRRSGRTWSALIFVDYLGDKVIISLEMKPPVQSIKIPSMPITEDRQPDRSEVMEHILANMYST